MNQSEFEANGLHEGGVKHGKKRTSMTRLVWLPIVEKMPRTLTTNQYRVSLKYAFALSGVGIPDVWSN